MEGVCLKYHSMKSWSSGIQIPTRRPCMGINMLKIQNLRVSELRMDECRELDNNYCKPAKPTSCKPSVVVCNVTLSPVAGRKSPKSMHFNRFSQLRKGIRKKQLRRYCPFPRRLLREDENRLGCRHMIRTMDSCGESGSIEDGPLNYSISDLEDSLLAMNKLILHKSESRETL